MRLKSRSLRSAAAGLALVGAQAQAANADFQNFFFAACTAPTGALATRCGETPNDLGNISGDSESSLNPSQNLSHNQPALSASLTRGKAARERTERLQNAAQERGPTEENAVSGRGPFSALINVHVTDIDHPGSEAGTAERGFDGDSRSLEAGFDYALSPRTVLGAVFGMERSRHEFDPEQPGVNFTPATLAGKSNADNKYVTLFGSFALGTSGFLELSAGLEKRDGTYERFSVFQESTRTVPQTEVTTRGDADGTTHWVSLDAGFDVARGAFSFGPFAGFTWTRARLDGYTEQDVSGSGLAMTFGDTTRHSQLAHAGLRAGYAISAAAGVFVPQLRVEYQAELEKDPESVAASFVLDSLGTQYRLTGTRADPNAVEAGFSFTAVLRNGWMPFLDYDVLLGSDGLDRQRATLGVRIEF